MTEKYDTLTYDIDGWFLMLQGNVLAGRIVGVKSFEGLKGDMQLMYLIRTSEETTAIPSGEAETDVNGDLKAEKFDKNSIIAVTERAAMRGLRQYVKHRGLIRMTVLNKIKIKNGKQTMWRLDVKASGPKAPMPSVEGFSESDTSPRPARVPRGAEGDDAALKPPPVTGGTEQDWEGDDIPF